MKRLVRFIMLSINLCILAGCANDEVVEQNATTETTSDRIENDTEIADADTVYTEFIEKIKAGFADGFQSVTTEELNIGYTFRYMSETMGYCLVDLDQNGTEELLLGENGEDAWDNVIYDIFTVEDGKLVHVVAGGERSRYYLCDKGEGVIANEGSGGAAKSIYAYYRYKAGELELIEAIIYDGWKDEVNPWFYSNESTSSENASSMFEEAAKEIIESYSYKDIEYIKFIK